MARTIHPLHILHLSLEDYFERTSTSPAKFYCWQGADKIGSKARADDNPGLEKVSSSSILSQYLPFITAQYLTNLPKPLVARRWQYVYHHKLLILPYLIEINHPIETWVLTRRRSRVWDCFPSWWYSYGTMVRALKRLRRQLYMQRFDAPSCSACSSTKWHSLSQTLIIGLCL